MNRCFLISEPNIQKISEKYKLKQHTVREVVNCANKSMRPESKAITVFDAGQEYTFLVTRKGVGPLNNGIGQMWQYDFTIDDAWQKYSVLVSAEIDFETFMPRFYNDKDIIVRTDSGCETGQVFGDKTCDCCEQLHMALREISQSQGMVINIPRQDGRGLGLPYKLATLLLQEQLGVDTIESTSLLTPDGVVDKRTYSGVIAIMKFFEIDSSARINFFTNNPHKREVFESNGYKIVKNTNIHIDPTEFTQRHFVAKKRHLGHEFA